MVFWSHFKRRLRSLAYKQEDGCKPVWHQGLVNTFQNVREAIEGVVWPAKKQKTKQNAKDAQECKFNLHIKKIKAD